MCPEPFFWINKNVIYVRDSILKSKLNSQAASNGQDVLLQYTQPLYLIEFSLITLWVKPKYLLLIKSK